MENQDEARKKTQEKKRRTYSYAVHEGIVKDFVSKERNKLMKNDVIGYETAKVQMPNTYYARDAKRKVIATGSYVHEHVYRAKITARTSTSNLIADKLCSHGLSNFKKVIQLRGTEEGERVRAAGKVRKKKSDDNDASKVEDKVTNVDEFVIDLMDSFASQMRTCNEKNDESEKEKEKEKGYDDLWNLSVLNPPDNLKKKIEKAREYRLNGDLQPYHIELINVYPFPWIQSDGAALMRLAKFRAEKKHLNVEEAEDDNDNGNVDIEEE